MLGCLWSTPPISTRTRDTRLRCDRSFPRRTGRERVRGIPDARHTGQAASAEGIAASHTLWEGEVTQRLSVRKNRHKNDCAQELTAPKHTTNRHSLSGTLLAQCSVARTLCHVCVMSTGVQPTLQSSCLQATAQCGFASPRSSSSAPSHRQVRFSCHLTFTASVSFFFSDWVLRLLLENTPVELFEENSGYTLDNWIAFSVTSEADLSIRLSGAPTQEPGKV